MLRTLYVLSDLDFLRIMDGIWAKQRKSVEKEESTLSRSMDSRMHDASNHNNFY